MDIAGLALFGSERVTGWLLLGGAGIVQALLGWRFYRASWPALRALTPNMDVLVALGTTVAFVFSAWVVLADRSESMFFDVSAAVLLFVSLGRFFEDRARASAGGAIRALLGLTAKSVNVLREGVEEAVPVEAVAVGEVFRVRPGERVALDGVIRAGRSALDESLLTGESMPVERGPGESVVGGALNQHGMIEVEATAVGEDTVLQRMAALVAEAQGSRAPVRAGGGRSGGGVRADRARAGAGHFPGVGVARRLVREGDGVLGGGAGHRLPVRPRAGDADGDHRGNGDGGGARHPHPERPGAGDGDTDRRGRARQDGHAHGGAAGACRPGGRGGVRRGRGAGAGGRRSRG